MNCIASEVLPIEVVAVSVLEIFEHRLNAVVVDYVVLR